MKDLHLMLYNFGFDSNVPPFEKQLDIAKELGFQGVELVTPLNGEILESLNARGLKIGVASNAVNGKGELENAEALQKAGVKFIGGEEGYNDRDSALWVAESLNNLGKALKPYGMKAVTHNHTGEFTFNEKDNEYCWETVANNTDPDLVSFKMDIGWATIAGADCEYLIKKYSGRVEVVHVKPATRILGFDTMNTRNLGMGAHDPKATVTEPDFGRIDEIMKIAAPAQGPMAQYVRPLKDIMETAEAHGAKVFILERDCHYADRVQVMREDAEAIRKFW